MRFIKVIVYREKSHTLFEEIFSFVSKKFKSRVTLFHLSDTTLSWIAIYLASFRIIGRGAFFPHVFFCYRRSLDCFFFSREINIPILVTLGSKIKEPIHNDPISHFFERQNTAFVLLLEFTLICSDHIIKTME